MEFYSGDSELDSERDPDSNYFEDYDFRDNVVNVELFLERTDNNLIMIGGLDQNGEQVVLQLDPNSVAEVIEFLKNSGD